MTDDDVARARRFARAEGCTCDPEILVEREVVGPVDPGPDGIHAYVATTTVVHSVRCSLVLRRKARWN